MNNRKQEFSDSLLSEFTDLQKEFIIKELYPSLKQALMHVSNLWHIDWNVVYNLALCLTDSIYICVIIVCPKINLNPFIRYQNEETWASADGQGLQSTRNRAAWKQTKQYVLRSKLQHPGSKSIDWLRYIARCNAIKFLILQDAEI